MKIGPVVYIHSILTDRYLFHWAIPTGDGKRTHIAIRWHCSGGNVCNNHRCPVLGQPNVHSVIANSMDFHCRVLYLPRDWKTERKTLGVIFFSTFWYHEVGVQVRLGQFWGLTLKPQLTGVFEVQFASFFVSVCVFLTAQQTQFSSSILVSYKSGDLTSNQVNFKFPNTVQIGNSAFFFSLVASGKIDSKCCVEPNMLLIARGWDEPSAVQGWCTSVSISRGFDSSARVLKEL